VGQPLYSRVARMGMMCLEIGYELQFIDNYENGVFHTSIKENE